MTLEKTRITESADAATLEKIHQAQHLDGHPPEHRRVPFLNMRHLLSLNAKTAGRQTYMIHIDGDGSKEKFDYAEFNVRVHQIANFLHEDLGVQRGDRVATIAYNHAETAMIYFACWIIGAAVAPQNVAEDDRRIAYILRSSEAVICLVRPEYLDRAEHIIHSSEEGLGAPNIRAIVQFGGEPDERYLHLNSLVKNLPMTYMGDGAKTKSADDEIKNPNEATPRLDDDALLVYTSGTTGAPKGVVLTQYNLLVDAAAIAAAQGITGGQRLMCVLPIHHVNGIVVTLVTPMFVTGSVVLTRMFSASHFWRRVVEERINIVSVVPTLLQFLLEQARKEEGAGNGIFGEGINRRGLTHFRHFVCGAGTLAVALAKEFEDTFGFMILHGYGLSETTCYSCYLPIDITWEEHQRWMQDYGYPSIGIPVNANEMAIFSADGSGQQLGPGERGEICIRGHNVMKYYDKRPDANAETFRFGWFRSGDEGFYQEDERGRPFFFITGRLKELINRGGVKFSPFDIEEVLLEVPGVKVGLAVAFKNDYYGEEVGAYVVAEDGVPLTEEAILAHCRARLTFEKAPKVIVFGTEIPVTSTGKYQRLKLQPLFETWEHTQFRKS
ncbi:MAG: class I adenylate-forming enzyme family protein [bacterium]|nr:class I adenylate-forming enzyme family protein [bacterium]